MQQEYRLTVPVSTPGRDPSKEGQTSDQPNVTVKMWSGMFLLCFPLSHTSIYASRQKGRGTCAGQRITGAWRWSCIHIMQAPKS